MPPWIVWTDHLTLINACPWFPTTGTPPFPCLYRTLHTNVGRGLPFHTTLPLTLRFVPSFTVLHRYHTFPFLQFPPAYSCLYCPHSTLLRTTLPTPCLFPMLHLLIPDPRYLHLHYAQALRHCLWFAPTRWAVGTTALISSYRHYLRHLYLAQQHVTYIRRAADWPRLFTPHLYPARRPTYSSAALLTYYRPNYQFPF